MIRVHISAFCCLLSFAPAFSQPSNWAELGIAAHQDGNTDKALQFFDLMLRDCEKQGDKVCIARSHKLLGESFRASGNHTFALNHLHESRRILEKGKDSLILAQTYNRLSAVFFEFPKRDSAIWYAEASMKITRALGDLEFTANNLNLLGAIARDAGNYPLAIEHLSHSYALQTKLAGQEDIPNVLNNIALTYDKMGQTELAIDHALKSLELSEKSGIHTYSEFSSNVLYGIYKKNGDMENALAYFEKYVNHHNEVFSAAKAKEIARIYAEYQEKKTRQENELLKQTLALDEARISRQTAVMFTITVILVFSLFIAWILFTRRKRLQSVNDELQKRNREIGEQKEQLQDLNRVKDHLFSIIGHDLKSPLNSLNGIIQLLKSGAISAEEVRAITSSLTDRLDYTTMLVDNLLNWARSQLDGFTMRPERVSLTDLAMSQVRLLGPQAEHKGVEITKELGEQVTAFADRDMVELVIRNLLANAIKFTPKGGNVKVAAHKNGKSVYFEVEDSGVGMNDEAKSRIMNREFFTTRGTSSEKGTGLGLMLVHDFVVKNGGILKVESQPGKGSRFLVSLPPNPN